MKKIITSAAMGSLFFAAAMADQAVVTAQEEQPVVVDEACDTACDQSSFGGLSFMLGIGGNFFKVKDASSSEANLDKIVVKSKNVNRLMGTIGVGFGKVFNNKFYAGIEALCDFTKSKKYAVISVNAIENNGGNVLIEAGKPIGITFKAHGIMPSLGLRFGYVFTNCNAMIYAKAAAVYTHFGLGFKVAAIHVPFVGIAPINNEDGVSYMNKSRIAPAFSLGIEKAFSKRFSARLEGEYMINARHQFLKDGEDDTTAKANGFNVCALISYNVNL